METQESYKEEYQLGDHLILKLCSNDIFEGDASALGNSRIDLINVREHNNDNKLSGIYTFYRNEISSIIILRAGAKSKSIISGYNYLVGESSLQLSETEYDRLREMTSEYIYLDKADSRYFEAVDSLSKAETIGVVALGIEKSRIASIKLLCVSTWNQVYLFDFVTQKQSYFYPELKQVFEAEYTCKVIHEAGPLLDILYRNYNVYVTNTFDTQIVDMVIKRKETGTVPVVLSNISDVLADYLKFPSTYLEKAMETTNKKWAERPLSERRRVHAAQLVTYLIPIKEQMQKNLFGEVYEAIEKIHSFYYYLDCFEFSKNWQDKTIPKEIQNLIPNLKRDFSPKNNSPKSTVASLQEHEVPQTSNPDCSE